MLKRNILLLLLLVCVALTANAQPTPQNDQRTTETKVADIVMLLPAQNSADFNRLMSGLIKLGDIIPAMSAKLTEPGEGDDIQIRSAIAGMAMYAGKANDKTAKANVAQGIIKALAQAKSDEIRDFLLIQLQYVAGDESVSDIAKYLTNNRLCDASTRVLVRINSPKSSKALFDALATSSGKNKVTLVQALGHVKYAAALDAITALATNADVNLRKASLFALANIASPASQTILKTAAEKAGYAFDSSDALGSYLLYLSNLNKNGNQQIAATASAQLLTVVNEPLQIAAKTAALELYTLTASPADAIVQITKALDSKNKQYRAAALLSSTNVQSPEMVAALLKKVEKEKRSEVKAEIITAFGVRGDKQALPFVLKSIKDKQGEVAIAAIVTASKLDGKQAIIPIIQGMNEHVSSVAKQALLTIDSPEMITQVAAAINQPKTSGIVKAALIDILGERGATQYVDVVFANVTVDCEVVVSTKEAPKVVYDAASIAAARALKNVVTEKDINRISKLFDSRAEALLQCEEKTMAFQQALYAAVKNAGNQQKQTQLVVEQMNKSVNQPAYYNVLAMIGGADALSVVKHAFDIQTGKVKALAFDALTRWSDFSAAEALFQISKNNPAGEYFDGALTSYVAKVSTSKNTDDQKLLLLRRALEIVKTTSQKNEIIRQIGRINSFTAMVVAGNYLNDAAVQQTAAQAVMSIALRNKEFYGKVVTDLLNKAIAVNKNPEAEYQKQAVIKHLAALPSSDGYVSMFNGKDLSGWKGLVENPIKRAKMKPAELAEKQVKADEIMRRDWRVENGLLVFDGKGYDNLCSVKDYGDIEMVVDWRIAKEGDAGVYLRGSPQVQIWDTSLVKVGAQVGSGGLYNNQKNPSKPLLVADNAVEEWNTFRIRMVGDKVTVYLNGVLVTDNVTLENYWDRNIPIFPEGAIELQAHGTRVEYRDIYVCEIPRAKPYQISAKEKAEGFVPLFNGVDMTGWIGNLKDYFAEGGEIICDPKRGGKGNLYTDREYSDFILRFEFQLTPAANNGLGIRTPIEGDAAYVGMELQILDNEADVYKDLHNYQYHGSVYGVIPAKRGYLKPTGEWNVQEVEAKGNRIKVTLNGVVILDGDIAKASKNFTETLDKLVHPGLSNKSGHIGFLGHGSYVKFRNLRIKDLATQSSSSKKTK